MERRVSPKWRGGRLVGCCVATRLDSSRCAARLLCWLIVAWPPSKFATAPLSPPEGPSTPSLHYSPRGWVAIVRMVSYEELRSHPAIYAPLEVWWDGESSLSILHHQLVEGDIIPPRPTIAWMGIELCVPGHTVHS